MDILNALLVKALPNGKYFSESLEIIFINIDEASQYAKNNHFSGICIL